MQLMQRVLGTALMLNAEVCVRVRAGDSQQVVLDVLVLEAAASGVTWLLTLDVGEAITVWTATGTARIVFIGIQGEDFLLAVTAPPTVVVRREEACATARWGKPHMPMVVSS